MHAFELRKLIKQDLKKIIQWANDNQRYDLVKKYKIKRWELRHKLYKFNMAKQGKVIL